MNIKPIRTEKDYEKTLARVEELWGVDENTPEGEEFEVLFTLVEAYEQKHYPIPPPHPIEAIKFRLDQMGIKKSELKNYLGSRSRVSDILNDKKKLSINMTRKLHKKLNIPAETLIAEY